MRTSALRVSVVYATIFAAALAALVFVIYSLTARFLDAEVDTVIARDMTALGEAYNRGGTRLLASELELRETWGRSSAVYLLADGQGFVLAGNLSSWPAMRQRDGYWVEFEIFVNENGFEERRPVRALMLELPSGVRLLVGSDLSERQNLTRRFAVAGAVGAVLVTLLALGIGYWQSRRILARVSVLNDSCSEILGGNLSRRLPLSRLDDEFDSLAREFNELLDRLARTTEILRASLHSAAHDLRSPMNRMRLGIEQKLHSDQGDVEPVDAEALLRDLDHMQRVLTALLQIAEAESGAVGAQPEDIAVDVMLGELGELYQPQAEEQGIDLRIETGESLHVRGHRQLLAQAVANLIDNALKYTPPGGHVRLTTGAAGNLVVISVADSGPGIPAAERNRAIDPFVRLGNATTRDGTGLGLSLAAAVARLHGGMLRLDDNEPGLLALLDLPRVPGPAA